MTIDNILMWVTQLTTADGVCSKALILLVTLKTRNQLQGESYVFSEVEQLSPSDGCGRSKSVSHNSTESEISSLDAGL